MKFLAFSFFSQLRWLALGIFVGFFTPILHAQAEDTDPFQMDTVQWMSFDRYKDEVKHGQTYTPTPVVKLDASASADAHYLNGAAENTKSGAPVIAAPKRPLDLPLLPGMNEGFDLRIGSTADDAKPVAQVTHMDSDPNLQLKQDWETTKEALNHLAQSKKSGDDSDDNTPLDVRMSFLPTIGMSEIADPASPHGNEGRPPAAMAAASAQKPQDPNAADYAKWSAELNAYKKRQLAAIQSDRQTLAALQSAIHQLGLQKQLDFMPGSDSKLGPQADYAPQSGGMDMPTAAPAKPSKN